MSLILTKVLLKGKPLDMIRDATNSDILLAIAVRMCTHTPVFMSNNLQPVMTIIK